MPSLPRPSGKDEANRFGVVWVRVSHHVMQHGSLRTTVPVYGSQALRIGTLRGILRDIEMSPDEFATLWRQPN